MQTFRCRNSECKEESPVGFIGKYSCDPTRHSGTLTSDSVDRSGCTEGTAGICRMSPMANVLAGKSSGIYNAKVHIQRPNGSRIVVIVNIAPIDRRQPNHHRSVL